MNDISSLPNIIDGRDFDCCFHFAWTGSAGPLRADYSKQLKNFVCSCNLVKALERLGCKKLVFASSIMEYECQLSIDEGIIPSVNNIYSVGKLTAHLMCELLAKKNNIGFYPVIISNIFGEGENSPRLINSTIKKILNGETPDFTDGKQMYDFIYIDDAVNAFIAIAENGLPFKSYYLGSLNPKPLKKYLIELSECFNPPATINLGAIQFDGVSVDYFDTFDIFAIKNDTGFVPKHSFKEGITNTIRWIKSLEEN